MLPRIIKRAYVQDPCPSLSRETAGYRGGGFKPCQKWMPHKHPGSGNLIWKGLRILPSKVLGMWGKNAQGSLID